MATIDRERLKKPARGSYALQLAEERAEVRRRLMAKRQELGRAPGPTAQRRQVKASAIVNSEQIIKDEVKRLDGYRCRWPGCNIRWRQHLDGAHYKAAGIGGNPSLSRCTPENVWALCRDHHGRLHLGLADCRPLDEVKGMRGPVECRELSRGEGRMVVVGVSEPPQENR